MDGWVGIYVCDICSLGIDWMMDDLQADLMWYGMMDSIDRTHDTLLYDNDKSFPF